MTMRERMLAVLRGGSLDRVPFVQYDGIAAPNLEVWELLGRDQMGVMRWTTAHALVSPNCRFEHEDWSQDGIRRRRTVMHTPIGALTEERSFEPIYGSSSVTRHYVREPADYEIFLNYLRKVHVRPNLDALAGHLRDLGDDGLPHVATARTPWQQMWVQWVSLTDLAIHSVECPDRLQACLEELGRIQRDIFTTIVAAAQELPLSHVVFPDNITAPAIGLRRFREYCLPFYAELAERLEPFRLPVFVHMDGDLKALWDAIDESAVTGIDSLSPPPDNDTSVGDAIGRWPDMKVWVNFPSSVHLRSAQGIYEAAREILEQARGSGRLQIQISENVPRFAWRTSYPAIVKAIQEYGVPG